MLFSDYAERAASTAIFPPEHGPAYTALGLCSEVGELVEADSVDDVLAELGDCLWYSAMIARTNGIDIIFDMGAPLSQAPSSSDRAEYDLVAFSGYLAGRIKKRIRDGADAVPDEAIAQALQGALVALRSLAQKAESDLATVAKDNLAKLASRAQRGTLAGSGDHR